VPDLSILPSGIEGKPILLIKNKVDLTNDVVGVEHLEHQILHGSNFRNMESPFM
jgi:hypothetical protein